MIDPKSSEDRKLSDARAMAEETTEHYEQCNDERSACAKFYHNTAGIGQWREKDLEYLKRQGRQPTTYNVLKTKINTASGMHLEQQRRAVVRAVGEEDKFKAEVLNAVCDRLIEKADLDQAQAATLLNGYIVGEGDTTLDVTDDPERPGYVCVESYSADPQEIGWDPGSVKEDRSDAGYVLWERWLTKAEFVQEYPQHKNVWNELSGDDRSGMQDSVLEYAQGGESSVWEREDYGKRRSYYYDRKKRRARIVRIEYKTLGTKTYAVDATGTRELSSEQAEIARADEMGYWAAAEIELKPVDKEEIHIIEFCGVKVLYDSTTENGGRSPNAFEGFSVEPFIYSIDTQARIPYGPVRDLMQPQEELNKGVVSGSDLVVGQGKTGWLYEDGAVDDPDQFEHEVNITGSAAKVAKNALVEGRIKERPVATFSPASLQRIETSLKLIDQISAISADLDQPVSMNEPATSVMIRYHKSQLGLATPRSRFDRHLKNIHKRLVQIVMRSMPDQQIEELIGNSERYRVQNGFVIDLKSNPQNPTAFAIRDLRTLRYDIEMDTSTRNQTLRNLKVLQWLQLHQAGIPIPLEMIAEAATENRAEREKMRSYAEQVLQQQAQIAQMQQQELAKQIQQTLAIEAGRVQESSRHNVAEEQLKREKQLGDVFTELIAIWEKADANEKRVISDAFRALQQRETARDQIMTRGMQSGGMIQ